MVELKAPGWLVVWTLLVGVTLCAGQAANNAAEPFPKRIGRALQWAQQAPPSGEDEKPLLLATAPDAFDLRDPKQTGGLKVLTPVLDQGDCNTCTAFAVAAAAETALAVGLRKDATEWASPQDLHFCNGLTKGQERTCGSFWVVEEALSALAASAPTTPTCLPYAPRASNPCAAKCSDPRSQVNPDVSSGQFKYVRLADGEKMQQWIRQHGPVLTTMQLYTDHLFNFLDKTPGGIYKGPGSTKQEKPELHAVVLVGYNNKQSYWVVRSSWGPGKGEKGYMKVAVDAVGITPKDNTWGLRFQPTKSVPAFSRDQVSTATKKGCYNYKASANDYYATVAEKLGVPLTRLLSDNLKQGQDPGTPLAGKTVLVCDSAKVESALPATTQADALLKIKAAVDPNGVLRSWVVGPDSQSRASAIHCSWAGVSCDSTNSVTSISLTDAFVGKAKLGGVLPDADVLLTLPKLQDLVIKGQDLAGTLPDDYGKLTGLVAINLAGNKLRGTLPAAWVGMKSLKDLVLGGYNNDGSRSMGNLLQGTLPPEWGSMATLRDLYLLGNSLQGPLPAAWGSLRLERLELSNNQLTGTLPDRWASLVTTRMTDLVLSHNRLRGALPDGWGSANSRLSSLYLTNNQLSGSIPSSWASMPELTFVGLADNELTGKVPNPWASKSLAHMFLSGNKFTGPLPVWNAPNLRLYYASQGGGVGCSGRNGFTGQIPANLATLMPRLTELHLQCNQLSGALPSGLGQLADLTILDLTNNPGLKGPLPRELGGLTKLRELHITNTGISGSIPESLGGLTSLETFKASGSKLSGCVPAKMGRLPSVNAQMTNLVSTTEITGYCP